MFRDFMKRSFPLLCMPLSDAYKGSCTSTIYGIQSPSKRQSDGSGGGNGLWDGCEESSAIVEMKKCTTFVA